MGTMSALTLCNRALQELGLPQVQTVLSAQDDQTGFQVLGLLNALGSQLVRAHDWQYLEQTAQFIGDGINDGFIMPQDYGRMVNQTQWSSKNKRPMYGPVSPQGWSWVQYGIVSVGVYYRYRIINGQFNVFPVPALGEQFNFYYISRDWVTDATAVFPEPLMKPIITKDTDVPVFDDYLMIAGMKMKLWGAKGMETAALTQEFEYMLSNEKSQSGGAPVISLDRNWNHLYINGSNVPDGSWNV